MPDLPTTQVSADFNELDENGRLHLRTARADKPEQLRPGLDVLLRDEEGSSMLGRVVEIIDGDLAVIQTVKGTWRDPRGEPAFIELRWRAGGATEFVGAFSFDPEARGIIVGDSTGVLVS